MPNSGVAVLLSGAGTNLSAIIEHGIEVKLVIADRSAKAIQVAQAAEIPTVQFEPENYANQEDFEQAMMVLLDAAEVNLIVLAGYMRKLGKDFVQRYYGHMVNIHPSLLPLLPGLDTHKRALAEGFKEHGCTVHWVNEETDKGLIIAQAKVAITENDDAHSLKLKVQQEEHKLYPQIIKDILEKIYKLNEIHTTTN